MIALLSLLTLVQPVALQASQPESVDELTAILQSEIKTLPRDIKVYHYATRSLEATQEEQIPITDEDGSNRMDGPVPYESKVYDDYFAHMTRGFEEQTGFSN